MKTMYYISFACVMAFLSIMFSACEKEKGDTTKPLIHLIEPAENEILAIGNMHGVHLEMDLSDNEMLKSYKINIHSNFDHHSHTKAGKNAFTFDKTYDLSGKKTAHIHHHDIKIPEEAAPGEYHLMIYCTDEAGNEAYVARNIILKHTEEHDHDH